MTEIRYGISLDRSAGAPPDVFRCIGERVNLDIGSIATTSVAESPLSAPKGNVDSSSSYSVRTVGIVPAIEWDRCVQYTMGVDYGNRTSGITTRESERLGVKGRRNGCESCE